MLPSLCTLRWASFWSFPRPISDCLPTPTLSLAWPSLGESHLLSPQSAPPPPSVQAPSLEGRSKALFWGARPVCLGGLWKGVQGPEPRLTVPWGLGGWEVGGGRLAREGKS